MAHPKRYEGAWWWLMAAIDPQKAAQQALQYDQGAYRLLRELSAYPEPNRQLQSCAALLSNHSHSALYEIANEDHAALPLLLPLNEYRPAARQYFRTTRRALPSWHVWLLPSRVWL